MLEHKWLPLNITETVKALFPDHGNSSFFAPMLHCGLLLLCNVQSSAHIPKPSNSTTAYTLSMQESQISSCSVFICVKLGQEPTKKVLIQDVKE